MNNNMMPNMVDPTHEMTGSDMANMTGNMPMPTHHQKMP
jgi:hypothetical protein